MFGTASEAARRTLKLLDLGLGAVEDAQLLAAGQAALQVRAVERPGQERGLGERAARGGGRSADERQHRQPGGGADGEIRSPPSQASPLGTFTVSLERPATCRPGPLTPLQDVPLAGFFRAAVGRLLMLLFPG